MAAECCSSCEYQRTVGYPSTSWASCKNMVLETDSTRRRLRLSHTVSFIIEKPRSHSALLPGSVSAAAKCKQPLEFQLRLSAFQIVIPENFYSSSRRKTKLPAWQASTQILRQRCQTHHSVVFTQHGGSEPLLACLPFVCSDYQ